MTVNTSSATQQRQQRIQRLQSDEFDILVIGGGASGLGCALDASSRGLKVALIEAKDYASGTSSRSSKLVHGGVRYLELAIKQRDPQQLQLVRDALHERAVLKRIAPSLVHELRLLTPCKNRLEAAYYWCGLKAYDALAGHLSLTGTHYLHAGASQQFSDHLQAQHLAAMVAYSDAQFDDAAMAIALMETAQAHGACLVNYCSAQATDVTPHQATVQAFDHINQQTFSIRARCVINCAGPDSDLICQLDTPDHKHHIQRSIGAHIVVDQSFWPHQEAILIPKTVDGRVLFILPWQGSVIIGTTDETVSAQEPLQCSQAHLQYLIENANAYLKRPITISDIRSSWAGVRPLLLQVSNNNSAQLIRDHRTLISKNGLVSLCGGKWTTYRIMAKDCIDEVCNHFDLAADRSQTHQCGLIVAPALHNLDELCDWAVQRSHAVHIDDVLARRSRLAFTNLQQALHLMPRITKRMQSLLAWKPQQMQNEQTHAQQCFQSEFISPS